MSSTLKSNPSRHAPQPGESPEHVLRRCGRTFWWASLALPPDIRRDLATLYAFCRAVDDIADEGDPSSARPRLDAIEAAIGGSTPPDAITSGYVELARRHGIPQRLPRELIDGVRTDLRDVRIATEDELIRYCYRVASTVGLMICRVLDVSAEGRPFAIDLGVAMQLTNIARDVGEDARSGRVYIPSEWLDHAQVFRAAAGDRTASHRAFAAAERLLDLAERYYRSADKGMVYLPRRARPGIIAASHNYERIGPVVRRLGPDFIATRAATSAGDKVMGFASTAASFAHCERERGVAPHDDTLHLPLAGALARI